MNTKITERGINQSQYESDDMKIYPEVHVLAGTLDPVVSLFTTWFGG
jgi:hypothetical protein